MEVEELAGRLLAATRAGKLSWEPEAEHENAYSVEATAGTLVIEALNDPGEHPYRFSIYKSVDDANEKLVESIQTIPAAHYVDWEVTLEQLWDTARRSALGYDRLVAELAAELGLDAFAPVPSDDDIPF
jgi:hypothetical protein